MKNPDNQMNTCVWNFLLISLFYKDQDNRGPDNQGLAVVTSYAIF